MWFAAAQYLYDRSKAHHVLSFGSPHGDVSHKIDEEEEDVDEDSDVECSAADGLHNSSSQTDLIRQRLSTEDNGNVCCHLNCYLVASERLVNVEWCALLIHSTPSSSRQQTAEH